MPTERLNFTKPRSVPRPSMRPLHYRRQYEVTSVPSIGKPRCWDVILVRRTARADPNKQASEIVKAWRGVLDGEPRDTALMAAHKLRDELDASLNQYR